MILAPLPHLVHVPGRSTTLSLITCFSTRHHKQIQHQSISYLSRGLNDGNSLMENTSGRVSGGWGGGGDLNYTLFKVNSFLE